ncbi:DUF3995 domain-containing protein [Kocuria marina subsp. indica]|nr:DUF3995 domain-containing protein [Kocuria indica]
MHAWIRLVSWLGAAAVLLRGGAGTAGAWGSVVLGHSTWADSAVLGHALLWDPLFVLWGLALAGGPGHSLVSALTNTSWISSGVRAMCEEPPVASAICFRTSSSASFEMPTVMMRTGLSGSCSSLSMVSRLSREMEPGSWFMPSVRTITVRRCPGASSWSTSR